MTKLGSPVLRELKAEWTQEAAHENTIENLVTVLAARFGTDAEAVRSDLKAIQDDPWFVP